MTHNFKHTQDKPKGEIYSSQNAPKIEIPGNILNQMAHITRICSTEIGWFMTVDLSRYRTENILLLDGCYLTPQRAHAATTEISAEAIANLVLQIGQEDQNDFEKRANRLNAWAHSHVNMATEPSGQDDHQMDLFNDMDLMIRIITNKSGSLRIDVFDYHNNIIWKKCGWAEVENITEQNNTPITDDIILNSIEEIPYSWKSKSKQKQNFVQKYSNKNRKKFKNKRKR